MEVRAAVNERDGARLNSDLRAFVAESVIRNLRVKLHIVLATPRRITHAHSVRFPPRGDFVACASCLRKMELMDSWLLRWPRSNRESVSPIAFQAALPDGSKALFQTSKDATGRLIERSLVPRRSALHDLETVSSVSRERKFLAIDRASPSLLSAYFAGSFISMRFNGRSGRDIGRIFVVKGIRACRLRPEVYATAAVR